MNHSINYMKLVSKNTDRCDIPIKGWDDALIVKYFDSVKSLLNLESDLNKGITTITSCDEGDIEINVTNYEYEDFDYFTSECITYDGTLCFLYDAIANIIEKVMKGKTYAVNKILSCAIASPQDYIWSYGIGDIIINQDFGMKNINGTIMNGETDWVCLPIKFDLIKKEK